MTISHDVTGRPRHETARAGHRRHPTTPPTWSSIWRRRASLRLDRRHYPPGGQTAMVTLEHATRPLSRSELARRDRAGAADVPLAAPLARQRRDRGGLEH